MRVLWPLLVFAGCPSPEEAFVLSGRLIDENGVGLPRQQVHVLRDTSPDARRCTPMEPFATLETDDAGRFTLFVYRQQQTLGRAVPHFFRVETSPALQPTWRTSLSFRFPAVDLPLPDLLVPTLGLEPPPNTFETLVEGTLDGTVAWRSGVGAIFAEERALDRVKVDRRLFSDVAPVSGFNMYESFAVEARLERPMGPSQTDTISRLRTLSCDVPGQPCPLTDGRALPVDLPPNTQAVSITATDILELTEVGLRGLQVEGEPDTLVIEIDEGSVGAAQWRTWLRSQKVREVLPAARNHCREPTGFLSFVLPRVLATGLRVRVEDVNGEPLNLTSLAEVMAR